MINKSIVIIMSGRLCNTKFVVIVRVRSYPPIAPKMHPFPELPSRADSCPSLVAYSSLVVSSYFC